jgi:hypothetical protein
VESIYMKSLAVEIVMALMAQEVLHLMLKKEVV